MLLFLELKEKYFHLGRLGRKMSNLNPQDSWPPRLKTIFMSVIIIITVLKFLVMKENFFLNSAAKGEAMVRCLSQKGLFSWIGQTACLLLTKEITGLTFTPQMENSGIIFSSNAMASFRRGLFG